MHLPTTSQLLADDTPITTVDGVRYSLAGDARRTVVAFLPDGGVVQLTLAEFKQQRALAAHALRRAEIARYSTGVARRLRLLRSTLERRLRLAMRTARSAA